VDFCDMTNESQTSAPSPGASRLLPVLLLLLAGSGCAALIYEIVWYQLLQLAIGSTAVSLGVLLATFMGGLCLGSVFFPRLAFARRHPLRVYAVVELGIALCGILVLFGVPLIDRVYIAGAEHGLPGMLLRGLFCAVSLLPPTVLMGASLPAISRWIESTPRGASWWGLLYGANTAGAVFGCLLAGFYLLRIHNTAMATYVAAALNVAVALVSLWLAARAPAQAAAGEPAEARPAELAAESAGSRWPVYVTIGLSGAGALGAEVVWTRLMAMMLGSTVYVFSIILAVFLVGLALGTGLGSWLSREVRPRLALGWCQFLLVAGIAWTAVMIADSLPYWPVNPMLSASPWHTFQLDLVRCLWSILPPTLFWGASFPLALAAVVSPGKDPGRIVGGIYAANTLGAILGALSVSLVLVPWIGTQRTQQLLLVLSASSALVLLAPHAWRRRSIVLAAALALCLALSGLLARRVHAVPGELIAYGRHMPTTAGQSRIIYTKEGRNSSVVVTQWPDGTREISVSGHVEATTTSFDMRLQRMVGHLPALLHPEPKSVLGIGFGAGVSAGTFTRYPSIQKITICEIEPVIPPASNRFFGPQNYQVMNDPRTRIVYDDARHYVLTTPEKFDIIASDPLDVFAKGTAALYSVEYFEAVKKHLNPGGLFTLYVPLYESDLRTVKSELATFFEAFPHATVWANTVDGRGYDMVFLGQVGPLKIDLDELERRLSRPDYALVAESLRGIGVVSPVDLLATYAGQRSDLGPWVKGAEINRDRDLRLQYLAGWGINSRLEDQIYRDMLRYRRPPENLFTGAPDRVQSLQYALSSGSGY
jgi:spermidine synthase